MGRFGTSEQNLPHMPDSPHGTDPIVFGNGTEKEEAHELLPSEENGGK